ncbi:hypothetical protein Ciccas_007909 [Cichlidogyrus casuarinus]|uniref:Uncharacterized protein n=1 Tax=Cichlidogyrus casuarinus TaxID=1844966 RepID=A0ABD2Q5L8_9PLAT
MKIDLCTLYLHPIDAFQHESRVAFKCAARKNLAAADVFVTIAHPTQDSVTETTHKLSSGEQFSRIYELETFDQFKSPNLPSILVASFNH